MTGPFYLLSAFVLGALHALEPGHGKTVVAAYLVSTKGRVIDAVTLGGIVTFTHTISVILLGVLTSVAAAYLVPEAVHAALEVVSGLLIVGVGAWMVNDRILRPRSARAAQSSSPTPHLHVDLPHPATQPYHADLSIQPHAHHEQHESGHQAEHHEHGNAGHHDHGHDHLGHAHAVRELAAVGAHAHGDRWHSHALPAERDHHHHGWDEHPVGHHHPDSPAGHTHHASHTGHSASAAADHSHAGDHTHASGGHSDSRHSHGGHEHSHALPEGIRPSLGSLVTLGISGGMVPCPAALALLLAAVAAGDVVAGLSLVIVFSLGLAVVLIAIGIAMVKAAGLAARYLSDSTTSRISARAGAVSAIIVTLLGIGMTARAAIDVVGSGLF